MRYLIQIVAICVLATSSIAAEWGMKQGDPGLKSAGPLAFGQNGVLFIGDTKAATVVAIDTGDKDGEPNEVDIHAKGVEKTIAKALGAESITLNDMAVNPASGVPYMSVSHGQEKLPAIVRLLPDGKVEALPTTSIDFAKVALPNAPADKMTTGRRRKNLRDESITDLAFSDGKVLVSGVVGKGKANVRELVFPFADADKGVAIEIYHAMHGRYEDNASVKSFIPFEINGEPHLLAGFQCTPLVKFPLKELQGAESVRGTTVAELGNRNRPLDMIVYKQGDKDFILMTNDKRGVMKISTENIERSEGLTERVSGTAGQEYEEIDGLGYVEQMDRLNDAHALVITKSEDESYDVHTIELP